MNRLQPTVYWRKWGQLTVDHLNLPVQKYDPAAYYNQNAPAASGQGEALDRVLRHWARNNLCVVKTRIERYPDAKLC